MFCNWKCAGYSMKIIAYLNGCELKYYLTCVLFRVHQTNFERNALESAQQWQEYLKTVNNAKPIFINFVILPLIHSLAYI